MGEEKTDTATDANGKIEVLEWKREAMQPLETR